MENIITVHFAAGQTQAVAPGALYQWAYGQTLKIEGLQLPTSYQVDFSNFEFCGSSIPRIGGADGVTVPAEVLATGQPVFAFIWLQNQNAGRTWYRIMIRVIPRPAPDPDEPNPEEESAIAEAIAALNAGVTAAETAQEKAEDAQDAAEAQALKSEGYAVGAQNGTDVGPGSPYYQNNAKFYADVAGQQAAEAGFVTMDIDQDGHLIYTKTDNVEDIDFYLDDGDLYLEVG